VADCRIAAGRISASAAGPRRAGATTTGTAHARRQSRARARSAADGAVPGRIRQLDGHLYYATVTVFYSDGTSATSGRSNSAPAHTTPVPPALPTVQTLGYSVCDSAAGRTAIGQILRGDPVNTATGAYEEIVHDLSMPSFGIPFDLTRTYSSISTAVGSIGRGWAFEYDMRMIGTSANPVFQDSTGAQISCRAYTFVRALA
jgi:hypothetical protein